MERMCVFSVELTDRRPHHRQNEFLVELTNGRPHHGHEWN